MNKTALIWGVNGGIGSALAGLLLKEGWQVVGTGRSEVEARKITPLAVEVDVASSYSVREAVAAIAQEVDGVDWWVYAIGDILSKPIGNMDEVEWQRILNANLNGVFHAIYHSQALLNEGAPVYILGAVSERMRLPGLAAYAAAKAGLEAFAEVLRKELKRAVVVVRPAAVDTALWKKVPFRLPANALKPEELAQKMYSAYQNNYKDLFLE
ncbi:MAG: SDR family NAD(P)-dependent oxidoreductase [Chloroflexota bacterium]